MLSISSCVYWPFIPLFYKISVHVFYPNFYEVYWVHHLILNGCVVYIYKYILNIILMLVSCVYGCFLAALGSLDNGSWGRGGAVRDCPQQA